MYLVKVTICLVKVTICIVVLGQSKWLVYLVTMTRYFFECTSPQDCKWIDSQTNYIFHWTENCCIEMLCIENKGVGNMLWSLNLMKHAWIVWPGSWVAADFISGICELWTNFDKAKCEEKIRERLDIHVSRITSQHKLYDLFLKSCSLLRQFPMLTFI